MATNSALNAVAFAGLFFHRQVGIGQSALSLRLGRWWGRGCSTARLRAALVGEGLRVKEASAANLSRLLKGILSAPGSDLAIVEVTNFGAFGSHHRHYLTLVGSRAGKVVFVDPGAIVKAMPLPLAVAALNGRLAKAALVVTRGEGSASKQMFTLQKSKIITLNLGDLSAGAGTLRPSFLLKNDGPGPVKMSFARGTCFCFRGARITTNGGQIPPHGIGRIELSFDRGKMGLGSLVRVVKITFADPHARRVTVFLHLRLTAPGKRRHKATLNWYPESIDLSHVKPGTVPRPQNIVFLLPVGVHFRAAVVGGIRASIALRGRPESTPDGIVYRYRLKFHRFRKEGSIMGRVVFRTNDPIVPRVRILIGGLVGGGLTPSGQRGHKAFQEREPAAKHKG